MWNSWLEVEQLERLKDQVQARLPLGWGLSLLPSAGHLGLGQGSGPRQGWVSDALLTLEGPDSAQGRWAVEVKGHLAANQVPPLLAQLAQVPNAQPLVVSPHLSQETQRRLAEAGASYWDSTGNVRLHLPRPAFYWEGQGASKNPAPSGTGLRSIKGPGAARVVRALCDWAPPYGLRELAERAQLPAGSLVRVVALLEREGLLNRDPKGRILSVAWQALLRRWAMDQGAWKGGQVMACMDPRGLPHLLEALAAVDADCVVSGGMAAQLMGVPLTPSRLLVLRAKEGYALQKALKLHPVEQHANVLLINSPDMGPYERAWRHASGLRCAGLSQAVADLWRSPGRGPNEAELLMEWMEANPDDWRA